MDVALLAKHPTAWQLARQLAGVVYLILHLGL